MRFLAVIFGLSAWLICTCTSLQAQAVLSPPFGLQWGESSEKLYDWAKRQKLDVSIHLPSQKKHQRHIILKKQKGTLPDHTASSLEARFRHGKLYEVVLNYADPTWDFDAVKSAFYEAKRSLTKRHGTFKLSDKNRSISKDKYVTDTISYHVEPVSGLFLMLSYTEVRDSVRNTRDATFSIIYHNDNVVFNVTSP